MYCVCAHKIGSNTTPQIFSTLLQSRTSTNEQQTATPPRHAQWWFTSTQVRDTYMLVSRSRWPRVLRRGSAVAHLLWLRVRTPPGSWMSVSCEYCAFAVRSICVGLIVHPEESYWVCMCVCVCLSVWSVVGVTLYTYIELVERGLTKKESEKEVLIRAKNTLFDKKWYVWDAKETQLVTTWTATQNTLSPRM